MQQRIRVAVNGYGVIGKRVAEARRMARAYDELAAMSDLELHDIGISRADIPAAVSGAYSLWKVEIASFRGK